MAKEQQIIPTLQHAFHNGYTALTHAKQTLSRHFSAFSYDRAAAFALENFKYPTLDEITDFHMSTIAERRASDPVEIRDLAYGLKYEDPLQTYYRIRARYDESAEQGANWHVTVQKLRIFESELSANIPDNAGQTETHDCENGHAALTLAKTLHDAILYQSPNSQTPYKDRVSRFLSDDYYADQSLPFNIVRKLADGTKQQAQALRFGPKQNVFSAR